MSILAGCSCFLCAATPRPRECACALCRPDLHRPETERERLHAELDRLGVPHNLTDRAKEPT